MRGTLHWDQHFVFAFDEPQLNAESISTQGVGADPNDFLRRLR